MNGRKLQRQLKTLTAEGRLSAIILIIMPFAVGGLIGLTSPGYRSPLTTTVGSAMLWLAAAMVVIGVFWIRSMIRVDK